MRPILAIDIGSTWTKGTLFAPDPECGLRDLATYHTPTTVANLADGFDACRTALDPAGEAELFYSSSAKGGLRIAALGIVPELTLKMAKEAACSAGGKISKVCAYKLNENDVDEIAASQPDIILFSGGTDGGNEVYILHNLELLKRLPPSIPVIYAGNRVLQRRVAEVLGDREVKIVANLLPELEKPNPEPAREAIRDLFLEHIVAGRGLDRIVAATGRNPQPTPYVMLEFLRKFYDFTDRRCDFAVVDMGGATTDFYSGCSEGNEAQVIRRGLPEPPVKRTVEGDVGMRVSAHAAFEEAGDEIAARRGEEFRRAMAEYIDMVSAETSRLPADDRERDFDRELAGACCTVALRRHAGRRRRIYTSNGVVELQTGRNLRRVKLVIGSGGFLSRLDSSEIPGLFWPTQPDPEEEMLIPLEFRCLPDIGSRLVMIANAAQGHPEAACRRLAREIHWEQ